MRVYYFEENRKHKWREDESNEELLRLFCFMTALQQETINSEKNLPSFNEALTSFLKNVTLSEKTRAKVKNMKNIMRKNQQLGVLRAFIQGVLGAFPECTQQYVDEQLDYAQNQLLQIPYLNI